MKIIALFMVLMATTAFAGDIKKLDATRIEESITKPAEVQKVAYTLDFLVAQKAAIEKDISRMNEELAKVNSLIAETKKLGVVETKDVVAEAEVVEK